jgi:hypothetical protein
MLIIFFKESQRFISSALLEFRQSLSSRSEVRQLLTKWLYFSTPVKTKKIFKILFYCSICNVSNGPKLTCISAGSLGSAAFLPGADEGGLPLPLSRDALEVHGLAAREVHQHSESAGEGLAKAVRQFLACF